MNKPTQKIELSSSPPLNYCSNQLKILIELFISFFILFKYPNSKLLAYKGRVPKSLEET